MKPLIPDELLDEIEALARLKTKSLPPERVLPFWMDVAHLKGLTVAEKGHPTNTWDGADNETWLRVKARLDQAMNERDFDFLDTFTEAWKKTGTPEVITGTITSGTWAQTFNIVGNPTHKPRKPITTLVVECIRQLQWRNERVPNRVEILDEMGKHRDEMGAKMSITSDELLEQLRDVGLYQEYFEKPDLPAL
jgi:hypothetical protein